MTWLFGEVWIWMLIAFVLGALVAWVVTRLLYPHEKHAFDDVEGAEIVTGGRS